MTWIELRLYSDADIRRVYAEADKAKASSVHHFNYEPWHPNGAVVRICLKDDDAAWSLVQTLRDEFDSWGWWDATPDEKLFGNRWPAVRDFFEASSRLALGDLDTRTLHKVTHCHLNANGLDVPDEIKFARLLLKERKRMRRADRRSK